MVPDIWFGDDGTIYGMVTIRFLVHFADNNNMMTWSERDGREGEPTTVERLARHL